MYKVTVITQFSANFDKIINEFKTETEIIEFDRFQNIFWFWVKDLKGLDLVRIEKYYNCSIFAISKDIIDLISDPSVPKVAVFDLDSTLIQMEVIDTLAASKPEIGAEVVRITGESMAGRMDFRESLEKRVALLEGIEIEPQWKHIKETVKFTPGVFELFKDFFTKENGWTTAVISGGFFPIAQWVRDQLNLSYAFANDLEIKNGLLTGRLVQNHEIIDSKAKEHHLINLIQSENAQFSVAIGDGANDLLMLSQATIGVAFNAKKIVQEKAKFRLNHPNIYSIYYALNQN